MVVGAFRDGIVFGLPVATDVDEFDPWAVHASAVAEQALVTKTADDLAKMPRATIHITNNGMETVYEGVWLHEVLKRAGVPQGNELRGKALSTYVLAQAQDGYQAVFSLGELDPAFIDNEMLLADTANGKPPFGAQGRFRLVPKDNPAPPSACSLSSKSFN